MGRPDSSAGVVYALAVLLITPALAGCASLPFLGGDGADGDDGDDGQDADLPWASYDEAKAADGTVFEPVNSTSPVRLKLLQPADPTNLDTGGLTVLFLLYDSEADEPITDADFSADAEECGDEDDAWCAKMPAMGHGTSPETNPTHVAFGVYEGLTTLSMGGEWLINVNPMLADGTKLNFDVAIQAAGGMMGPPEPKTFASFEEALNATGTEFGPVNAENLTHTQQESDSGITSAMYSNSFTFPVDNLRASMIGVEISFQPGPLAPAEDMTFNVSDPNGTELGSFSASSDATSGTITVGDVPAAGEYTIGVSGSSSGGGYTINISVAYNLTLKLLDPADPTSEDQGEQPFVFLLYDADDGVPATGANVTLEPYMPAMGHGSEGNEDPTPQLGSGGNETGVYEGLVNYAMGGAWQVNLTASLDRDYRYDIPVNVTGSGGMQMG